MSEHINKNRREFLGAAAIGVAAAPLILGNSALAQSAAKQSGAL